jgi:hypothetical protein
MAQIVEIWLWVLFLSTYLFFFGLFFERLMVWKTVLGVWLLCNTIGFFMLRGAAHAEKDEEQEATGDKDPEDLNNDREPIGSRTRRALSGSIRASASVLVWLCLMALGTAIVVRQRDLAEASTVDWSLIAAAWRESDVLKIYVISGTLLLGDFLCFLFIPSAREMIDRFVYGPLYETHKRTSRERNGQP